MLESDNFDLAQERKKLLQEVDKERRDFLNRVDGYATEREAEVERSAAVIKLNSLKQKYERENEKFSKEIDDLNDELASKDFIIKNQQYEMDSLNYRISELTA